MLSESIFQLEFFTLSKTNISPEKSNLKMIFLFQRWDMLVPQRVNPVVSPGRFRNKKGYEKMAPCNGCTQMPSFKSQCITKLGALGGCHGVPGVFFAFPWKSLPRNSREKVVQRLKMNWLSLFFFRWCVQIYYLFSLLFGRNDPFWSMWQYDLSDGFLTTCGRH